VLSVCVSKHRIGLVVMFTLSVLPQHTFFITDADCFYPSCETLFNPHLRGKAVAVLSARESCVIARSKELKRLLPLGAPIHRYRKLLQQYEITLLAANFELYFDMSTRIMLVLAAHAEALEQYSIDEAWASFAERPAPAHLVVAREMREAVRQHTGLAVSVGVAPSKVLAKAALLLAKKAPEGVAMLSQPGAIECALQQMDVEDVWLIGSKSAQKLRAVGIRTAYDLKLAEPAWVRKRLNVVAERVVWELRGVSCLPLEMTEAPHKTLGTAKALGKPVEKLADLKQVAASSVVRLAERLRAQHSLVREIGVSLSTNPFRTDLPHYSDGRTVRLVRATNDTSVLIEAALEAVVELYKEGYEYHRVPIFLLDLVSDNYRQTDFLAIPEELARREDIMRLLDEVNRKCGAGSLTLAAAGVGTPFWLPKRMSRSPSYTTDFRQLTKLR
jgi:DNA polymerase V